MPVSVPFGRLFRLALHQGRCWSAWLLLLLLGTALPVHAQNPPETLRVATRLIPPFVVEENGQLGGFSIELWDEIATKLSAQTTFRRTPNVGTLLKEVEQHKADLAIAAISITSERDKKFDFSQPILEAGLQIMVRGSAEASDANPLEGLLRILLSRALMMWIGIGFVFILIPAHLIWFLERRHPDGLVAQSKYPHGLFKALWWAAATLTTQGEEMPRSPGGRMITVLWMVTGVVFVSYFTAQLTANLTIEQIKGNIKGPDDLPGKRVVTIRNSTSANYLRERKVEVQEVEQIQDAYQALEEKRVDAVVFDAPVLLYYASHDGKGKVQVVGQVFRKENYGIVFPLDSPYRKKVDNILLTLREDGTYQKIYDKWFSDK